MINYFEYGYLFLLAFIFSSLTTPLMRLIALKHGVIDHPSEHHKTHKTPTPYLGGVAIILSVISVSIFSLVLTSAGQDLILIATTVLVPATLLGIVGLIDDLRKLTPLSRFVIQTVTGLASAVILISTRTLGSPTGSIALDIPITVFWIVGITNAINFFDNIDGGASGTIVISAIFLFILALQSEQFLIAALSLVIAGSTAGFLLWNRAPAKIYMGDAGSLFLGVLIATLTIRFDPNPLNKWASFSIPIFLLAMPILDTSVAVTSRLRRRVSPFTGGRDHLSHRIMRLGLSKNKSIYILWMSSLVFCFCALVISNIEFEYQGSVALIGILTLVVTYIYFLQNTSDK